MNNRSLIVAALMALILCAACSRGYSGGGTIGTGLPGDFRPDAASGYAAEAEAKPFLSGVLTDELGGPIAGADLEIETDSEKLNVRTDSAGRFFTSHVFRADEELRVTVIGDLGESSVRSRILQPVFTLVLKADGTLLILSERYK